ncbi:MAG: hypothetical protein V3W28_02735, partial [Thermoplasmata archaeon]
MLLLVGLAALLVSMQGLASGIGFLENQASSALDALGDVVPLNDGDDDDAGDDDEADGGAEEEDEEESDDNSGPGGDADEAEDDDESEDEEEREVRVEIDDENLEVTIRLESKTPEREDEVKVHFQADEGQMKVSFERDAAAIEEVEMRVTFHRVLEFQDVDGDGAFDPLDDEIVQQFFIENLNVVNLATDPFEMDGKAGHQVTVDYAFPGTQNGRFGLVFWVFGQFAFVNGVPVGPSEAKIDIHIEDFPFLEDESAVAVDLRIKTEFEVETERITFEEIVARGEEFAAFFRWSSEATVDGETQPVTATVVRERMEAELQDADGEFEDRHRHPDLHLSRHLA